MRDEERKRALILGIGGQDGSYLAELLLARDYAVHGLVRHSSVDNLQRIAHLRDRVILHQGDLTDAASIIKVLNEVWPHELYNEADQDNVDFSTHTPSYSMQVTAGGVANVLEAVRTMDPSIKVFQPITAHVFDGVQYSLQNEKTPFKPSSPYACAKLAAYHLCRYYRAAHDLDVRTAFLFNHDSPRRSERYLLHKICAGVVRVALGKQKHLLLGRLDLRVDIGYAQEFMEGVLRIMDLDEPDDFVLGTGRAWQIWEMVHEAMVVAQIHTPVSDIVQTDDAFLRPGPAYTYRADCTKARKHLQWEPQYGPKELIHLLVEHEFCKHGAALPLPVED